MHWCSSGKGLAQTYADCLKAAGRAAARDIKRLESILGGDGSDSSDQLAPVVDFEGGLKVSAGSAGNNSRCLPGSESSSKFGIGRKKNPLWVCRGTPPRKFAGELHLPRGHWEECPTRRGND